MSLDMKEQSILVEILHRADQQVALDVDHGVLHPATALAVFGTIRDVVRPLDPNFADRLIPRATEDAASRIAASAITTQLTKGTHEHS
ncbi:MAG: hypothetical protein P4L99_27945 [Chthoniobacter sp.]|nr:hypothetical protein [Chthoniobacter sp.]